MLIRPPGIQILIKRSNLSIRKVYVHIYNNILQVLDPVIIMNQEVEDKQKNNVDSCFLDYKFFSFLGYLTLLIVSLLPINYIIIGENDTFLVLLWNRLIHISKSLFIIALLLNSLSLGHFSYLTRIYCTNVVQVTE